jgi:hypothetical protein
MKPEQTRLRQEEQTAHSQVSIAQRNALEFASVDDLLRHDRGQNPAPDSVRERLDASISAEPRPVRSWFRRLFG